MPDTNNPNDPFFTNPFAVPTYQQFNLPAHDFEHMVERHVRYLMVHNEDFRRMATMIGTIRYDVDELIAGRITNQNNTIPNTRNFEPLGIMVSVSQLRETMDLLRDLKRTADNINMSRIEAEMFRLAGLGASVTPQYAADLPTPITFRAREQVGVPTPTIDQIIADAERTVQAETRAAITPQTDAGPPY